MSPELDPSASTKSAQHVIERDRIVRTATAMLRSSQDITRRSLSRRAGLQVSTVVSHFKCRSDLLDEIASLGLFP